MFVYGKSKYDVILPIPCSTKEENSDWRNYFRKQHGCVFNVATHVLDNIAHYTSLPRALKNALAILPDTNTVPLDLSWVTTARRNFMIGLLYFYSYNNSHF